MFLRTVLGYMGGVEVHFYSLLPVKEQPVPNEYKGRWLPQPIWTFRRIHKFSVSAGNRTLIPQTSSLWPSQFTDWAIPAPTYGSRERAANDDRKLSNIIRNIRCVSHRMPSAKFNLWQILNCYMFRQRSGFIRETTTTEEYESNSHLIGQLYSGRNM